MPERSVLADVITGRPHTLLRARTAAALLGSELPDERRKHSRERTPRSVSHQRLRGAPPEDQVIRARRPASGGSRDIQSAPGETNRVVLCREPGVRERDQHLRVREESQLVRLGFRPFLGALDDSVVEVDGRSPVNYVGVTQTPLASPQGSLFCLTSGSVQRQLYQ